MSSGVDPRVRAARVNLCGDREAAQAAQSPVGGLLSDVVADAREVGNGRPSNRARAHRLSAVFADLEMVTFGQNCIILIKKSASDFATYYDHEYRFSHRINESA